MDLKKVEWHNKTGNLIQDSSEGLEFAFVSKDYKQVHQLVWCKDFLTDVIYGHVNNKKAAIWGFSYNPQKHPAPDMQHTRLLLTSKRDREFPKKIVNSLDFMNQIEEHLGIQKTTIEAVEEPPRHYRRGGVFIFTGSKEWQKAPPMLSLYALLIRSGLAHHPYFKWNETIKGLRLGIIPPYYSEDSEILQEAERGMGLILNHGPKLFHSNIKKNYPNSVPTDTIHNDFGIVGFTSEFTKSHCPHWHRFGD